MPAGWPECDDTSYTILALRRLGHPASHPAIRKGVRWLEQMQNRDGSWSTFVRDSRMPFDHDCPYITGHVLSALRAADKRRGDGSSVDRALSYLQRAQRQDGTFASIWFREPTAGTASVLEALADWGLAATAMAQRAFLGLRRNQNPDGGWGGSPGTTSSTAEETAWAVLALLRENGAENDPQVLRGLEWLMQAQRPDGGWDQWPVGLYYSAMWYSDSYFALTLPAQALGRARKVLDGRL
jgi:squalene-hopene/tetraprenyl-beta-curcumene cyclase